MSNSPNMLPWQVRLGQTEGGAWVAEVTLPSLPTSTVEEITRCVERYQKGSSPHLAPCFTSTDNPNQLFFLIADDPEAKPVQILENSARPSLADEECRRLATVLAETVHTLHGQGLGLWVMDSRLLWEVHGKYLLVPAFWLPFSAVTNAPRGRIPPEIATLSFTTNPAPRTDIFAIAFTCYEALADAPPLLPHPKLPGDWNPLLKTWDRALDAGLRLRADRRPNTVGEWMALFGEATNATVTSHPPASPQQIATSPAKQPTTPPPERASSERRTSAKKGRSAIFSFYTLLAVTAVGVALFILSHKRGLSPTGPFPLAFSSLGSFQRGFADSIIRYEDRSYDGAHWKEIYSSDNLKPGSGHFKKIRGWDDSNFALLGHGDIGGTAGALLVLFRPGMKDLAETFTGGGYSGAEVYDARFFDSERIALFYSSPNAKAFLATKGPRGMQRLGEVDERNRLDRIALLAPEIIHGRSWHFSGGKLSKVDKETNDYYVRRENNVVAGSGNLSMEVEHVTSITALAAGKAVGLWTCYYSDFVAIVRYESGKWLLVQELQGLGGYKRSTRAWFIDDRNMVAVGSHKVVQVRDGKMIEHPVTLDGKPISGEELIAVWGNSPDKFWVADKKGNVFAFNGGAIIPVVRGPEFKDDDKKFNDIWVSPSGTVFAVSKDDKLYQLR